MGKEDKVGLTDAERRARLLELKRSEVLRVAPPFLWHCAVVRPT